MKDSSLSSLLSIRDNNMLRYLCLFLYDEDKAKILCVNYHAFTIIQTAYATIPSSRPTKPMRSEVVALIEIASMSQPIILAKHLHMAGI